MTVGWFWYAPTACWSQSFWEDAGKRGGVCACSAAISTYVSGACLCVRRASVSSLDSVKSRVSAMSPVCVSALNRSRVFELVEHAVYLQDGDLFAV